ncbi:MAG TPA: hypothetical protein VEJ63_06865 [Planctomycetota bacterium]|nr:hypothetical protein [Planctomycetota bacterium]
MVEANTAMRTAPEGRVETAGTSAVSERTISQGVRQVADSVMEVASAQLEIWKLQGTRLAALAGFGVLGLILFSALLMYGFTLLDSSFALALARTDLPDWASPLIRGGIYFGVPMMILLACWHTMVGWGSASEDENKVD